MYIPVKMIDFIAIIKYDKVITRRGEVKMTLFSEKLKLYIEVSSQTIYQLSKKAEVNRTVIHKTISGERVPGNDFLEKLYGALMLSPEEKKELRRLAERARVGEKVYRRREKVKAVIEALNDNPLYNPAYGFEKRSFPAVPKTKTGLQIIQGRKSIERQVMALLGDVFYNSEKPGLALFMPFQEKYLYELLYNFYITCDKETQLLNLIAIEKDYKEDSACLRNLELLSSVLLFSLTEKKGYRPYYYYTNGDHPYEEGVSMPYFIKTDKQVMTLSPDFETAFVYDGEESYGYFSDKIDQFYQKAELLTVYGESIPEMFGWSFISAYQEIIEPAPCMGELFTDERIDRFLRKDIPMRDELYTIGCNFYRHVREDLGMPLSMFSFDGLIAFMNSGILPTLPTYVTRQLSMEERQEMLEEIIKNAKSEEKPYIAINRKVFKVPVDLEIIKVSGQEIAIRRFNERGDELTTLFLHEAGLVDAFTDFMDYLKTSELVYDQETMVAMMKRLRK